MLETEKGKKQGISRRVESQLVLEYQQTRCEETFLKIYLPRIDTFKYLAEKYSYICEDMESEAILVFIKAVNGYRPNNRLFNTYYYTSVLNHIRNILKSKKRNKRTLINGDDPSDHFLYLDDAIDGEEGGTFHDIVSPLDNKSLTPEVRDLLNLISNKSQILFDMAIHMMNTGKRPLRRKKYELVTSMIDGESMSKCLDRMTGISRACYKVIDFDVMGKQVRCVVDVSRQSAFCELLDIATENADSLAGVV